MDFSRLTEYLDRLTEGRIPCCDLSIFLDGREIYRHFSGQAHPGVPCDGTQAWWLYSATKPVTMTAAMQLIERGRLRLDAPVREYLPEFAHMLVREGDHLRRARTEMTVEHLMTMQAGLSYDTESPSIQKAQAALGPEASTRDLVAAIAREPLLYDPGTHYYYSLAHDVVGAIIEVVSWMRLSRYMRENLFDPLGLKRITFHPDGNALARATDKWVGLEDGSIVREDAAENSYRLSDAYESGGAGLFATVDDYIRLFSALSTGGTAPDGTRILSQASIDALRRPRLTGASLCDFYLGHHPGYSYGLGVRTRLMPDRSAGEFGWDGAAGACLWVDPRLHMAAFYAQHVRMCPGVYDEIHPRLRQLIYQGLGQ